ncbi:MAG: cadherin-like beta sandwich domain-containing protein, partial [Gemmatimonadota bacterium]
MTEPRPGSDASLESLALDAGPISPGFSPGRRAYALHVTHGVSEVRISWATADPGATVIVTEGAGAGTPAGVEAKLGGASGGETDAAVPLRVGRSLIAVEVAAADGQARARYEVKVVRAHPAPDWERVLEAAPWRPRDSAGELVFGEKMWLFGGYLPELVSDVWSSADGVTGAEAGAIPSAAGLNLPAAWTPEGRLWVTATD